MHFNENDFQPNECLNRDSMVRGLQSTVISKYAPSNLVIGHRIVYATYPRTAFSEEVRRQFQNKTTAQLHRKKGYLFRFSKIWRSKNSSTNICCSFCISLSIYISSGFCICISSSTSSNCGLPVPITIDAGISTSIAASVSST